jgi:hypothetical protein
MSERERRPVRNAGAFLGPSILVPVSTRPLGSEPPPRELETDDEPPVSPTRPGPLTRLVRRLTGRGSSTG